MVRRKAIRRVWHNSNFNLTEISWLTSLSLLVFLLLVTMIWAVDRVSCLIFTTILIALRHDISNDGHPQVFFDRYSWLLLTFSFDISPDQKWASGLRLILLLFRIWSILTDALHILCLAALKVVEYQTWEEDVGDDTTASHDLRIWQKACEIWLVVLKRYITLDAHDYQFYYHSKDGKCEES